MFDNQKLDAVAGAWYDSSEDMLSGDEGGGRQLVSPEEFLSCLRDAGYIVISLDEWKELDER